MMDMGRDDACTRETCKDMKSLSTQLIQCSFRMHYADVCITIDRAQTMTGRERGPLCCGSLMSGLILVFTLNEEDLEEIPESALV